MVATQYGSDRRCADQSRRPCSRGYLHRHAAWSGFYDCEVYFGNITNGASTSVPVSAPPGLQLVGNSAEWIVEAPFAIMGGDTLPDYGEVFFSDCEAYIAGGGGIQGGTGTPLSIVAGKDKNVVSRGLLISPAIIQCSFSGPP
jgi:hypothetical protein